ncbi:hypothetical protein Nepgr_030214 [Nepenthes gracilis]|uniref:Homeobox domain-containing protein n=1 Tax=Nepenthes gracilis TaxID=150966 RepID=A0AAD3TGB1_NEPGR|nr:hypothetical protein Nepgr_030214 [Nepenthes gracilis]
MELALSIGDPSEPFTFLQKKQGREINGFCTNLSLRVRSQDLNVEDKRESEEDKGEKRTGLDAIRLPSAAEEQSSPISGFSSFMEFLPQRNENNEKNNRSEAEAASDGRETETEKTTSRGSDDEGNGSARKRLRLSKEQSAFLEESFKEHHTLNPKQKLSVAEHLSLHPRQVEVWFQNKRTRMKLKQTEVDCEYLKKCCETLAEENRGLQKELQELRALKASRPFYMQLLATTLTMCPSCLHTANSSTASAATSRPS